MKVYNFSPYDIKAFAAVGGKVFSDIVLRIVNFTTWRYLILKSINKFIKRKKKECLAYKDHKAELNSKIKSCKELYKYINWYRKAFQARANTERVDV